MKTNLAVLLFFVGSVLAGTDKGKQSELNGKAADFFLNRDKLSAKLEMAPSEDCLEGDMQLTDEQKDVYAMMKNVNAKNRVRVRRAASRAFRRWPDNTFVYRFDPALSDTMRAKFEEAIHEYRQMTCIHFEEAGEGYTGGIPPVLVKGTDKGCYATVGGPGGKINLEENRCNHLGVCLHEIGHSLGFYHEQTRSDRDEHIVVLEENIMPGYVDSFRRRDRELLGEYDIQSIMHYSSDAFSKDGRSRTIIPLDLTVKEKMGKQQMLTRLDIYKFNLRYDCLDHCPGDMSKLCKHGGVPSKSCTCNCPDEYTGPYCDIFNGNPRCGGENFGPSGEIQSPGFPNRYPTNFKCIYSVECAENERVKLHFKKFNIEDYDCFFDNMEIKMGNIYDETYPDEYCGDDLDGDDLYSKTNLTLITFHSDFMYTFEGYDIEYSCVEKGESNPTKISI